MDEKTALSKMVPPGRKRPHKNQMLGGVIQVMITRACGRACYSCTRNSNLGGKPTMMTLEQFEAACKSLQGYWGVVGIFGGSPTLHPQFEEICAIFRQYIPYNQRGLWSDHPHGKGKVCRETFCPPRCNLNVHMDKAAWDEFKRDWPESMPFGLNSDARHSPCFVSMKDMGVPEEERWRLISGCDINQHWSALIGVFRGQLRAYFCEIAYSQAILHEQEEEYPNTGIPIPGNHLPDKDGNLRLVTGVQWWQLPMTSFRNQVRQHCHSCGVPLRGYGQLAISDLTAREQVSQEHAAAFKPKTKGREVELITEIGQLNRGKLQATVDYMGNATK